ncbi:MAG: phenylalanine--tRNA ligase subunit beta, partial [Candidatus Gracilibacteria bacterium]
MLISLDWLKDFVQIKKGVTTPVLANLLTLKTAEIDSVTDESEILNNIVIGHVETILPHPNADKLKIAKTFDGQNIIQIVCGGENLKEGMYVALAKIGAKVKWHGEGDYVTLERVKIRGEESEGMICASNEIGLTSKNEGPRDILDLSSIKPKAGTPLSEILKRDDVIFEFDNKSLTHRPDLWGHYGIAREIAALTDSKFKPLNPKVQIPTQGTSLKVEVNAKELCPRYCGLIIENIKVEDSPDWLTARLKKTGHGAHNNIVDVTNYIMAELGQPMHAFDKKFIEEKIIVRQANKGEKITTLDNKTYELSPEMLVIADSKKPVAVAGIMGGEFSGINENTTSIILESANFNAGSI